MSRIPYDLKWRKKAWLYERPFVLGTFCQSSDPMGIEILSIAGFDFVVVDCEHGPFSAGDVKRLMIASTAGGIVPIVRVRQKMGPLIVEALDTGALGVLIPHVSRDQDAREAVAHARYYPLGERGINPYIRATGYSPEIFKSYLNWANENLMVILQVEGLEGVRNIDEILQVPGLDILFLGPYDLSQSLGVPGQVDHPAVMGKMEEVISRAKEKKIALGTFADNVDAARKWIELGVRFMAVGYDTRMLLNGARAVVSSLKGPLS